MTAEPLITRHNPPDAPPANPRYTQVVRIDLGTAALLMIAGQVAIDSDGKLVGAGDVLAQADQIYANLRAVLASQGAGLEHVVKTTTFAKAGTDLAPMRTRSRYEPDQIPAASLVMVSSLADPEWLLEIEAIAVVPVAARVRA